MGLNPQVIGTAFPNAYPGFFARQPDCVAYTYANGETTSAITIGTAVFRGNDGNVVLPTSTSTAEDFVGVTGEEVKTNLNYLNSYEGLQYVPGDLMTVLERGCIGVFCQNGTPERWGKVYVRIAENASYPNAVVGGFEAEPDGNNTVLVGRCVWNGPMGANGAAELKIMSIYELPSATSSAIGGVKQGVAVADAAGDAPTAAEFKALLDSLRDSGAIASA